MKAGAAVKLGAVSATAAQFYLRWAMQHAAAGGACAAASPVGDSGAGHMVLPKPTGVTCTAACAANEASVRDLMWGLYRCRVTPQPPKLYIFPHADYRTAVAAETGRMLDAMAMSADPDYREPEALTASM